MEIHGANPTQTGMSVLLFESIEAPISQIIQFQKEEQGIDGRFPICFSKKNKPLYQFTLDQSVLDTITSLRADKTNVPVRIQTEHFHLMLCDIKANQNYENKTMSPTVFRENGFRFFFFSREESRMHVHVVSGDGEAKFWLEPEIELSKNYHYSRSQLKNIESLIEEHYNELVIAWQQHFGS